MKILVVEDEVKVLKFLKNGLSSAEFTVDTASNLEELFSALLSVTYDAIVLDRLLAGRDSLNYIPDLRAKAPTTKILVLSALSDVEDKISGLEKGADDYLAKPFDIQELIARIRAMTRRDGSAGKDTVIRLKDLTIELDSQRVERNGTKISLTAKEFKLLSLLARKPNKIYSKADLLNLVWEMQHYPESNVIEVLVNHLRAKIDKEFPVKLIHSRRGTGYWAGDPDGQ